MPGAAAKAVAPGGQNRLLAHSPRVTGVGQRSSTSASQGRGRSRKEEAAWSKASGLACASLACLSSGGVGRVKWCLPRVPAAGTVRMGRPAARGSPKMACRRCWGLPRRHAQILGVRRGAGRTKNISRSEGGPSERPGRATGGGGCEPRTPTGPQVQPGAWPFVIGWAISVPLWGLLSCSLHEAAVQL